MIDTEHTEAAASPAPAPPPTPSAPIPAAPTPSEPSGEAAIAAYLAEPLDMAQRLFANGGEPLESAQAYGHQVVESGFEQAEQFDREHGQADAEALREGRRAAAELLDEWKVAAPVAKELTRELSQLNERWMHNELPTDETLAIGRERCETELRGEWGKHYTAKLALAQRTYQQAVKRAPWLENLMEHAGGGNRASVVKHFARIGEQQARRAKR